MADIMGGMQSYGKRVGIFNPLGGGKMDDTDIGLKR